MHRSLAPLAEPLRGGAPLRAVFFGTSVTAGCQVDPDVDASIAYPAQWHAGLRELYPAAAVEVINAGVRGNLIGNALARVDSDVIARNPDLAVIEFGINDCWYGEVDIERFEAGLERLVSVLQGVERPFPLVLMTANMLNHEVTEAARSLAWFADRSADAQRRGMVAAFMERVRKVGRSRIVPVADGYARWQACRERGENIDLLLANRANHPNAAGHRLLAEALLDLFRE